MDPGTDGAPLIFRRAHPRGKYADMPIRRSGQEIRRYADTPVRRYADTPIHEANTPIRRYADPGRKYADTPVRRYADPGREGISVYRCIGGSCLRDALCGLSATLYGRFGLLFSSFKGVGSHCIHSFLVRAGDL